MLVIEKARALALNLANPARVMALIPTAKQMAVPGAGIVVVPHRMDEVRVLRNIGIKAPAPILHYYDWPGRLTPYEHQKATSAFLTLHPRCIVLNEIGCVDANTEYLSPEGWRRIADYKGGSVAQYLPETGGVEFVDSPEFVKLPCPEMIRIRTSYGVDQLLSPEHRVLYVASTGKRMVRQAYEIHAAHKRARLGWKGRFITTFAPASSTGITLTDAELRVQVAVMADGHFPVRSRTTHCVVRLKKERKKARLRVLLQAAGIQWREHDPEYASALGFTVFRFAAPMRVKSYEGWAWAATQQQLRIICDEAVRWDGTQRKSGGDEFFTCDRASADFIQYAFAATGRTASIRRAVRDNGTDYTVHARRGASLLYACGKGAGGKTDTMWTEPSPDGFKYCFMVPSTFLVLRRNGCIFATGNTGKTHSALWAADYLIAAKAAERVLILSPLSTLESVWGDTIFKEFYHRKHVTLYGSAKKRLKLLQSKADFFIINHDGFGIIADEAVGMFDVVIVDEAAVLRNANTTRTRIFRGWMEKNPNTRLWLMTGTPTPNAPTDAWVPARLMNNPYIPTSRTSFRDMVMYKVGMHSWFPRPEAMGIVQQVLQPSVRYTRDECFDLPDTIIQTRTVDMTTEQKKYYVQMFRKLVAAASTGEDITAVNEAVKMQKLVQIACGVAYDDAGNHVELDCTPRVEAVKEIIEEAGEKVIVFVPLTGTLNLLHRELSKHWSTAVVNGAVKPKDRHKIFKDFQEADDPRVLIAHPATMSHGLTLTAAATIIWYGPINSTEQYIQANGRIERAGKRHVSNVVNIEAAPVEHKIYKRLKDKQTLQGVLLELIKENTEV